MTMNKKELRAAGEKLAEMCAAYHKEVAENSKCRSDQLVNQIEIDDSEYIYKIIIIAESPDDDE